MPDSSFRRAGAGLASVCVQSIDLQSGISSRVDRNVTTDYTLDWQGHNTPEQADGYRPPCNGVSNSVPRAIRDVRPVVRSSLQRLLSYPSRK